MDKGLDNHYQRSLSRLEKLLEKWREGKYESNRHAYMDMFKTVKRNDNNIARIYDDKGGSKWIQIITMQLRDKVITEEDLREFPESLRNAIISWSKL